MTFKKPDWRKMTRFPIQDSIASKQDAPDRMSDELLLLKKVPDQLPARTRRTLRLPLFGAGPTSPALKSTSQAKAGSSPNGDELQKLEAGVPENTAALIAGLLHWRSSNDASSLRFGKRQSPAPSASASCQVAWVAAPTWQAVPLKPSLQRFQTRPVAPSVTASPDVLKRASGASAAIAPLQAAWASDDSSSAEMATSSWHFLDFIKTP
jgi:hypothetical protein